MNNLELNKDSSIMEESLSQIAVDAFKYAPSKIAGTLINLFLVPLYTNLLTPAQYGLYNVAVGVLSLFCIIFSDWIGISALRFFKKHYNLNNITCYFTTVLSLLVFNLLSMYILALLLFKPITSFFNIPGKYIFIIFALIIPVSIRALFYQIIRAQIKPIVYTIMAIVNQLLTVLVSLYFIKSFNMGAMALLFGMGVSITITDIFLVFYANLKYSTKVKDVQGSVLGSFYKFGVPIAMSNFGMWMITNSNKIVLQHFDKSANFNGLLGVGYNLTFSVIMPIISILMLAAAPRIINRYELDKNVSPIIKRLIEYYFLLFTPVILFLSLYANEIVQLFSNSKYAEASILIPFLAVSGFLLGLAEYTTFQYYLLKKTYIDTAIRIIPGALGILLNMILIPKYGLISIGISVLASNLLYFVLSIIIRAKEFRWNLSKDCILKNSSGLIACTAVIFLLKTFFPAINMVIFLIHVVIAAGVYFPVANIKLPLKTVS